MAIRTTLPVTDLRYCDIRDTLNAHGGVVNNFVQTVFTDGSVEFRRRPRSGETPQEDGYVHYYPNANINRWSIHKPYRYPDPDVCPREIQNYIIGTLKCGLTVPLLYPAGEGLTFAQWEYSVPNGSDTQPLRLGDFRGYNPSAVPPFEVMPQRDTTDTAIYWNTANTAVCPDLQFYYNQGDIRLAWVWYDGSGDYLYIAATPYDSGYLYAGSIAWVSEDTSFSSSSGIGTIDLNEASACTDWMHLEDRKYTWAFFIYRGPIPSKTTVFGDLETLDTSEASLLNMPLGLTKVDIYKFWLTGLHVDFSVATSAIFYNAFNYQQERSEIQKAMTAATSQETIAPIAQAKTGFLMLSIVGDLSNTDRASKTIGDRVFTAGGFPVQVNLRERGTSIHAWMEDDGVKVDGSDTTFTWPTVYAWKQSEDVILYSFVLPRVDANGNLVTDPAQTWPVSVYSFEMTEEVDAQTGEVKNEGLFYYVTDLFVKTSSGGYSNSLLNSPTKFTIGSVTGQDGATYSGSFYRNTSVDFSHDARGAIGVDSLISSGFFPTPVGFTQETTIAELVIQQGDSNSTGINLVWQGNAVPMTWNSGYKLRMEFLSGGHAVSISEGNFNML